ncbi:hypothetical protein A9264_01370 [Vibrio sp. UCD-FRSSP16_10]|uniref:type IV pilus modification PilV family protein n=1 Tax=unclassified Vibrio TaxID=2614977 RepID=UPI0008014E16|nr:MULTISPECIES: type II secretion system protein [unclassified Vibrio]OBT17438.1 hypothetical protein A9260_02820 [Vibrio sp. UCD-FRSSP16_30]OBT23207.1 hypothetical protein A9264_01370 [Vibrio sp. UCD-FRSSP16_10]
MNRRYPKGFTLIELVVGIVIFAIAMISYLSFLAPQIQRSANPHYQARAGALGQSFMNEILSKSYDENSDHNGGAERCDAEGLDCIGATGPDTINGVIESIGSYNDVDDYIGCWYTSQNRPADCTTVGGGNLSDVFGRDMSDAYPNFRVEVDVTEKLDGNGLSQFKKIEMIVVGGSAARLKFFAERGNY